MRKTYQIIEYGSFVRDKEVVGYTSLPQDTFDALENFVLSNSSKDTDALELMEADSKMWFCPGCGSARPSKEDFCPCGVRKTSYVRPEQEVVQEAIEEQEVPEEKSKMAFVMGELMKFFPVLPMEKELSKLIWSILFYIYVSPIIFAGVNMAVSSVLGLTLILALLTPLTSVVVNLVGTAYAVLGVVFSIMYYIGRRFE